MATAGLVSQCLRDVAVGIHLDRCRFVSVNSGAECIDPALSKPVDTAPGDRMEEQGSPALAHTLRAPRA